MCNFHADTPATGATSQIFRSFKLITIFLLLLSPNTLWANVVEDKFIQAGLIDVNSIDQSIQVNLVNSAPDKNFFRENYYHTLNRAYLRKPVAIQLKNAQKLLKKKASRLFFTDS